MCTQHEDKFIYVQVIQVLIFLLQLGAYPMSQKGNGECFMKCHNVDIAIWHKNPTHIYT